MAVFSFQKLTVITSIHRFRGEIRISPLESSYGLTVGNALRRVLLFIVVATTSVRIEGVDHEFSTISGVVRTN